MKKILFFTFAILTVFTASAFCAPEAPEQTLTLQGSNPRKAVTFNHASHAKIECVTCHHLVQGRENYEKCATAGCHDNLTAKKGEKSLFAVMHAKEGMKHQTCLECHLKAAAAAPDKKKELTGCAKSRCHP